jgi:hypothetical protein
MHNAEYLLQLANTYYQRCNQGLVKVAIIKQLPSGKWQVLSQKGKNLGIYDNKEKAVERLRQVEYFKHHDKSKLDVSAIDDKIIDLTDADDFSYSAIMRLLRKKTDKDQVKKFLSFFKNEFDKAVKNKLQKPEKVALQNSLIKFNKIHKIKVKKKLVKSAAVTELGSPATVGQYLANIVKFTLMKLPPEGRAKAMDTLRNRFYTFNAAEISQKNLPPSSAIGQSITFVKHVLFNHNEHYIREVLNNLVRNLYL